MSHNPYLYDCNFLSKFVIAALGFFVINYNTKSCVTVLIFKIPCFHKKIYFKI